MRTARVLAAIAMTALLASGCTSWFSDDEPADTSELRGVPVDEMTCPTDQRLDETMPTPTTAIADPMVLVVCPRSGWEPRGGSTASSVRLTPGMAAFDDLTEASSLPDEPRTDQACLLYGEAPVHLFAKTQAGTVQLVIPVDECGHYQDEVWRTVRPLIEAIR